MEDRGRGWRGRDAVFFAARPKNGGKEFNLLYTLAVATVRGNGEVCSSRYLRHRPCASDKKEHARVHTRGRRKWDVVSQCVEKNRAQQPSTGTASPAMPFCGICLSAMQARRMAICVAGARGSGAVGGISWAASYGAVRRATDETPRRRTKPCVCAYVGVCGGVGTREKRGKGGEKRRNF